MPPLKYDELPRVTCFRLFIRALYHVMAIPICDMALNTTMLAGNNRITLPNCGILGYNKFVYCTLQLVLLLALVLAPEYMVVLSSVAT